MAESPTQTSDIKQTLTIHETMAPLYRQHPDHRMKPEFMPDEMYAQALASIVFVCADVVMINRGRQTIYLARRRHLPMAGWWVIGGRVRPGETETAAIQRAFKRETSLELPAERFEPVPLMIRYQWSEREQLPQDLGSDNVAYNFAIELSDGEAAQVAAGLDAEEYDPGVGLKECNRAELERLRVAGELHPAIWDLYGVIFERNPH